MQPRWMHRWLGSTPDNPVLSCVFLGGTNKYDLWIDTDGDLRVVCGDNIFEWDYFEVWETGELHRVSEEMPLTEEELNEIETYLALFAPDWRDRRPVIELQVP